MRFIPYTGLRKRLRKMVDSTLRSRFGATSAANPSTTVTTTIPTSPPRSSTSNASPIASPSNARSGPHSPTAVQHAGPPPEFDAAMAASFHASKGTELLQFARHKVEERSVHTSLLKSECGNFNILLMRLPYARLLTIAEDLGLRKRDLEGTVRTFRAADVHMFTTSPTSDALFSQSEQILLLEFCLNGIKPDANFDDVVGNESILQWCKRQKYLDDVFPLHHRPSAAAILAELSWSTPLYDVGGISKLQQYFGDQVAIYFAFLTFYTKALVTYGGAGLLVAVCSRIFKSQGPLMLFVYSIFATLWGAAFISLWKRRNIEIVYMWNSLILGDSADEALMSMSKKEDLRPKFVGVEVNHRITGEKIAIFPKRKKLLRYIVSLIVVLISLFFSSRLMLAALDFEDIMHNWIIEKADLYKWSRPFIMKKIVLKNFPTVVYLACLNMLDMIYSIIARKLTLGENHKYHSDFENSLVGKLVLFQFLNMNMAYLHVAFVRKDYMRLVSSIRSVLLAELVVGTVKKTIVPIFMARRKRKAKLAEIHRKKKEANPDLEDSEIEVSLADMDPISMQLDMDSYDGVFDDYLELVRQFSQISLFAAAFPLGALLAAVNNFIEIHTDTYKLVNMTRRASPRRSVNIGAWIRAFEFLSIISIMTNLGIITVTANFAYKVVGHGSSKADEYFWMIVIEHVLVVSRFAFSTLFEGIPSWVRDQRAKERFLMSKKVTSSSHTNGRVDEITPM